MDDQEVEKYAAFKLARSKIAEPRFRPQGLRIAYRGLACNLDQDFDQRTLKLANYA